LSLPRYRGYRSTSYRAQSFLELACPAIEDICQLTNIENFRGERCRDCL